MCTACLVLPVPKLRLNSDLGVGRSPTDLVAAAKTSQVASDLLKKRSRIIWNLPNVDRHERSVHRLGGSRTLGRRVQDDWLGDTLDRIRVRENSETCALRSIICVKLTAALHIATDWS